MERYEFLKQIRQDADKGEIEEIENLLMRYLNCTRTEVKDILHEVNMHIREPRRGQIKHFY